jgi:thiamine biosynthesis lipoprotein
MGPEESHGPLSVDDGAGRPHWFERRAMACVWGVGIVGADAKQAEQAARAGFAEIERLEGELSRFVATSDVARINALRAGQAVRVGVDVFDCLELALRVSRETAGAFDVTAASGAAAAPGARIELDRAALTVRMPADGTVVDLGGIGKGYALDQAAALLRDWGVGAALLHCGQSTVYALGSPAGQPGWTVGVRDPRQPAAVLGQVRLRGAALSGSGRRLHGAHIVDPRTGNPATGADGAWALAPSAALADALSTAFMVLSAAEVSQYCARHAQVAGLVLPAGGGEQRCKHFGRDLPGWASGRG